MQADGDAAVSYASLKEASDQVHDATEAIVAQLELDLDALGEQTQVQADAALASYAASGFVLTGTPIAATASIYQSGLDDMATLVENAQIAVDNLYAQARGESLSVFANSPLSAASGLLGGSVTTQLGSGEAQRQRRQPAALRLKTKAEF